MDEETATILFDNGYRNPEDIDRASIEELTSFMGITNEKALMLQEGAKYYLTKSQETAPDAEAGEENAEPSSANESEENIVQATASSL